jgi:FixJ family two-component response regulator
MATAIDASTKQKKTILVIEDDYTSRIVMDTLLTDLGFRTKIFEERPIVTEIEDECVLIVDVRIGKQKSAGIEFIIQLPDKKRELPLIFMSNWNRSGVEKELSVLITCRKNGFRWIAKPFEIDTLESEINKAINLC